jgi:hypothetical protein
MAKERQETWRWAQNLLVTTHVANMNVIANFANSGWHYEVKHW